MKKIIIDVATGLRQEVDLTVEEIAEREELHAKFLAEAEAVRIAKANAIAKLEALGLTLDEVKVAFGLEAE
jgi:hypothetical protein